MKPMNKTMQLLAALTVALIALTPIGQDPEFNRGLALVFGGDEPLLAQEPSTLGVLKAPTSFPITMDGKAIGSTKLPAGTKVEILQEDAATGKTLVKAHIGQAWVVSAEIEKSAAPAPTASAAPTSSVSQGIGSSPVPSEAVTAATNGATEVATPTTTPATTAPVDSAKRVLVWGGNLTELDFIVLKELEGMGYTVDIRNSDNRRSNYITVSYDLGGPFQAPALVGKDVLTIMKDYEIVYLANPYIHLRGIQESIKPLNDETKGGGRLKHLIMTGLPAELVAALLDGDMKKAEKLYERHTGGTIVPGPSLAGERVLSFAESSGPTRSVKESKVGRVETTIFLITDKKYLEGEAKAKKTEELEELVATELPPLLE
jgi:hypothetical protein